jgi:alkylation response protein AidB-like acyl-CoA dehydrogenase
MQLVLNDDQAMLARTALEFVAKNAPASRVRALRDSEAGFDPALWQQMAALGWTSIPFSEADGGLGLGMAEVVCVTEALGRGLATEPYLSSILLAGGLLAAAGTKEQKAELLAPLIGGETHVALAHVESRSRFDPFRVELRAEPVGEGYRLSGEKTHVLGGNVASTFLVVARTAGSAGLPGDAKGLSIFVVPRATPGLQVIRQRRVDAAPAAIVRLQKVEVPRSAHLGPFHEGGPLVDAVLDRAAVALAGEMLGGMSEALDRTLAYLKERIQFGTPIGTFQALKHRAARLFIEVELTRSAVMSAARAIDEGAPNAKAFASVAKARANDAFLLIANEAVQMHGGIGMTDEHDIGLFLKRARGAEMTFGDSAYYRGRFATAPGF